jgi:hypothetical protein
MPTDIDRLIRTAGTDRFARASELAWASAARTGRAAGLDADAADLLAEVVWDLTDMIADFDREAERIDAWLGLYRRCPCYSLLFEIGVQHYRGLSGNGRRRLWDGLRELLDSADDRLADPITYSLWVDYFEDPDLASVEEAWRLLVDDRPLDRALRRVLENSGPAPVALKRELVSRVIGDERWHLSVFLALVDSRTAMRGDWDRCWGQEVYENLREPLLEAREVEDAIAEHVRQEIRSRGSARRDVDPAPIRKAFSDLLGRRYYRP